MFFVVSFTFLLLSPHFIINVCVYLYECASLSCPPSLPSLALLCLALLFHLNRDEISRIAVKRDEESYPMVVCEPQSGYGLGMVKRIKKVVAAD